MICIECHQECYTHSTCETCKHAICNDCFGDRLRARCGNCYGAKKYQSEDTFLEEIDEEEEAEVRRIEEEERSLHKFFTNDVVGKWEELYLKVTGRSGFSQSEKFVADRYKVWDEEEESVKKIVEGVQRRIESNKRRIQHKEKQLITSYFTKRKNENGSLAAWASKPKKAKTIHSKKRFSLKFLSQ